MKKFRLLRADEIECRISEISKKGTSLNLLLYKTARTDADLLDEAVGSENWENDFKLVDGVLYGGIGIRCGDRMVWKWDAGTESNTEAEKGRASDAFKRAGFKHGIGRELYSAPRITIYNDKCSIKDVNGKWKCYDLFEVAEITYDEQERINGLVITCNGKLVYRLGEGSRTSEDQVCEMCRSTILPYYDDNGKTVSVKKHVEGSVSRFGRKLCIDCIRKGAGCAE